MPDMVGITKDKVRVQVRVDDQGRVVVIYEPWFERLWGWLRSKIRR